MRRIAPVLLAGALLALVAWLGPRLPATLPNCAAGPPTPLFCAAVPTSPPGDTALALSAADALRPCAEPGTARPSFCLVLPTPGPSADRSELLVRRQDACAQLAAAEAPDFCLVAPAHSGSTAALRREIALTLLRQRLGTEFRRTTVGGVQLWTEVGVAAPIVDGALRVVAADAAAVQDYFGRGYQEPPAVFLFNSRATFSVALQRHFGADPAEAARLSQQLLGVLLVGSDAVAINGEAITTSIRPVAYRHELAHVLIHQLAGDAVPAWLDEGLATRVSAVDPAIVDPARAGAIAALRTDRRALTIFTDRRDWQTVNAAFDGRAYSMAAEAVLGIERRVGRAGMTTLLERLGQGASIEDAFPAVTGETLDDFIARLPAAVSLHRRPAGSSGERLPVAAAVIARVPRD